MSNGTAIATITLILVTIGIISLGLIVYHFLIFPNVDGVAQDLRWYNYDEQSQHFLYWFWVWFIVFFSGLLVSMKVKT